MQMPKKNTVSNKKIKIQLTPAMASAIAEVKLNSDWVAGFVAGDGSFYLGIDKSGPSPRAKPFFQVALITTNQQQLWALKEFFCGVGSVCSASNNMSRFIVSGIKDNHNRIVPFFKKGTVLGNRAQDFQDFAEAVSLMNAKVHLTPIGHARCVVLKTGIHTGRNCSQPENKAMIVN